MKILIVLLIIMSATATVCLYSALILASDYDDTMEELEKKHYHKGHVNEEDENEDERSADI